VATFTLTGELPELTRAIDALGRLALPLGITFTTADFGGVRTEADTLKILKFREDDYRAAVRRDPKVANIPITTWRPITPFGRSHHNWGAARDLRPLTYPAGKSAAWALAELGRLAPRAGLQWGGLLNGGTFSKPWDAPHFQLPITVSEARTRYLALHASPSEFGGGEGFTVIRPGASSSSSAVLAAVGAAALLAAGWLL
jgi:hypothetical protein